MDGPASFNNFKGNQGPNAGNNANNADAEASAPNNGTGLTIREHDTYMPIANVTRIMRRVLPSHAKISDEAKETVKECVTEYISFITGEANERCQTEHRRIITAEDVIWAMSKLGFDDYVDPLTLFLNKYREAEGDSGSSVRGEPLPIRQPTPMPPMNPAMFVPPQPQPQQLRMNPMPRMNLGPPQPQQQLQQQSGYYLGNYGDGSYGEGSSSGGVGPFSPHK